MLETTTTNSRKHPLSEYLSYLSCHDCNSIIFPQLNILTACLTKSTPDELPLGLDKALREEEWMATDNIVTLGNSLLNREPFLQMSVNAQMMGKNPRRNPDDASYTFGEQWTTERILQLSQIYIEPILKVSVVFKGLINVNKFVFSQWSYCESINQLTNLRSIILENRK